MGWAEGSCCLSVGQGGDGCAGKDGSCGDSDHIRKKGDILQVPKVWQGIREDTDHLKNMGRLTDP